MAVYCYDKNGKCINTYTNSIKYIRYIKGQRVWKGHYRNSIYYGNHKYFIEEPTLPLFHYIVGNTKQYIMDWESRNEKFCEPDNIYWQTPDGDIAWYAKSAIIEVKENVDYHLYPDHYKETSKI